MAYTGAALSFMLRDLPGPVVLTGSQRSSDRPSSDSFLNLKRSLMLAARSDLGEVCILMHSSISDDASAVHRACRARKMHTSRRDAFVSINAEPLGYVTDGGIELDGQYRRADPTRSPRGVGGFSDDVLLVGSQPTLDAGSLRKLASSRKALVMAGTGLGHLGSSLVPVVKELVSGGKPVILTSQCINGRVNLRVYSSGRALLDAGVIEAGDMTPEAALVKVMWCIGTMGTDGQGLDGFKEIFLSNICGELDPGSQLLDLNWSANVMDGEGGR
jgi:glutamyl-tRNA(Gln) amidotransferase subunit D